MVKPFFVRYGPDLVCDLVMAIRGICSVCYWNLFFGNLAAVWICFWKLFGTSEIWLFCPSASATCILGFVLYKNTVPHWLGSTPW